MTGTLDTVLEAVAGVFLVVGCLMSVAAGIGMLRFPDLLRGTDTLLSFQPSDLLGIHVLRFDVDAAMEHA